MTKPSEMMVPLSTLRTICGGDEARELDALLKSGRLKVRAGQAPLVEGVRAFLDAVRAGAADADLTTAMTAARTARAEAAELAQEIEARALIPDSEAEAALLSIVGAITSSFASLPAMATRNVVERRRIEDAMYSAQVKLSQAIAAADLTPPAAPVKTKAKGRSR
jgi:hypothetical protein